MLLVGNYTGGAIAQLVAAYHPERLSGLVLTNCDAYERFFPLLFLPAAARGARAGWGGGDRGHAPGARRAAAPDRLREADQAPDRARRHRRLGRRRAATRPPIRRDLRAVLRGVDKRHLLDAVPRLRAFGKPVTLAWAREDRLVFPPSVAERLAGDFPNARIEWIDDSLTFVPEDRPHELAAILRAAAGFSSQ